MEPYRPKNPIAPLIVLTFTLLGVAVGIIGLIFNDTVLMAASFAWILFGILAGIVANKVLNR